MSLYVESSGVENYFFARNCIPSRFFIHGPEILVSG